MKKSMASKNHFFCPITLSFKKENKLKYKI